MEFISFVALAMSELGANAAEPEWNSTQSKPDYFGQTQTVINDTAGNLPRRLSP
jgi:hypothetical protein